MGNTLTYNITKNELNLNKTLDCGQAFRWNKQLIKGDEHWIGIVDREIWILKQSEDKIETNLSLDRKDKFINYFNLDLRYNNEIDKIELNDFERRAYNFSKGIHILRQNLLETMVTFLVSSCNTMHNIRNIVNKLCTLYGNKITTEFKGETITRYSFPTLEKLKTLSIQDLQASGMGFRARYLLYMLNNIDNEKLEQLRKMDYYSVIKSLKLYKGIGDKVANCIALFGLYHIQAFPIDTHIKQIIDKEFNGNIDILKYGAYAGIIQQYMFYYKAFN